MSYAKFISSDYVFKHTLIDSNVDPDEINKFITQAQDINIQQVIGNTLYVKLMNDIATTGTSSGKYLELLTDYIQRCQAEWVVYHSLPFLNYKLTNKSVSQKNSEHSQPSQLEDIKYLRAEVRNTAEFYSQRIREFIINNQSSFPEYFTNVNINSIRPKSNNYFGGIYIGRGTSNYPKNYRDFLGDCD